MTRLPTEVQFIGNVWGLKCEAYWPNQTGGFKPSGSWKEKARWEPNEPGNPYTHPKVTKLLRCEPLQKGNKSMGVYVWTSPGQVRIQGKRPWLCRFSPIAVQKLGAAPPGPELVAGVRGRMRRREEMRPQLASNLSWAVDCSPMPRRRG